MLSMKLHETAKDFELPWKQIRMDFLASSSKNQTQHYGRFIPRLRSRQLELLQVEPPVEWHITLAVRANIDIQSVMRFLHGSELQPLHVNFTSGFFQKLHKNKRSLEVFNVVLYRRFSQQRRTRKSQTKRCPGWHNGWHNQDTA